MCSKGGEQPTPPALLIAEDDDDVRQFAATVFEGMGVTVFVAANGYEALDVLALHPEIVALFSDVRMPQMDGVTLAHEALKRYPHLRITLATGFIANIPMDKGFGVIQKPYRLGDLVRLVSDLHLQECPEPRDGDPGTQRIQLHDVGALAKTINGPEDWP
jgi:CheY-like chemotaxis protein